jgi:16S rRNA (guanine(527)-N(7))-methyltransferase RsmG
MGAVLPEIEPADFERRLAECGFELGADSLNRLLAHYRELRRWNVTLSLVGPGTAAEIVERHYAEALAALPWVAEVRGCVVDLGSGAGFPGFVLAACRPDLEVVLVEARERKATFLAAAARQAGLAVRCLNVRVAEPLPQGFPMSVDVYTCRALRLPQSTLEVLDRRCSGRWLFWSTPESLEIPPSWAVKRQRLLGGATRRSLIEVESLGPSG